MTFDELQSLNYLEVKGTGLANQCPILEETGSSIADMKPGQYSMEGFCMEPTSFKVGMWGCGAPPPPASLIKLGLRELCALCAAGKVLLLPDASRDRRLPPWGGSRQDSCPLARLGWVQAGLRLPPWGGPRPASWGGSRLA